MRFNGLDLRRIGWIGFEGIWRIGSERGLIDWIRADVVDWIRMIEWIGFGGIWRIDPRVFNGLDPSGFGRLDWIQGILVDWIRGDLVNRM